MLELKFRWLTAGLAAMALLLAVPAQAQSDPDPEDPLPTRPVPWHHAHGLSGAGGLINPALLVGFNPQPEPPARLAELSFMYPPDPILLLRDQENPQDGLLLFDVFLAIGAPGGPLSFSMPKLMHGDRGSTVNTHASLAGALVFDVFFDIWSSSDGMVDPASLVGFNPQPEPPHGFTNGVFGMSFGINSLSDAMLRLRIFDAQGNPIQLTAIPEPPALAIVALAVAWLGWRRANQAMKPRSRTEASKLPRLGNTCASCASLSPNHFASVAPS